MEIRYCDIDFMLGEGYDMNEVWPADLDLLRLLLRLLYIRQDSYSIN